jgi:alpha-galactosidase/6-phospho-beta-glucosidase family protein
MGSDAKIVLVGAGSVSFGLSTLGDLMTKGFEKLAGAEIVLHDINPTYLNQTYAVFKQALAEATEEGESIPYRISKTTDINQALPDANYVVLSIEHGNRIETWKQDYYIPRKHGSRQIFGENGGPGGAFHTWRQVPPMLEITKKMENLCPDAWLFNFSNPMHNICRSLNKASKIKVVGMCHGIGMATSWMNKYLGVKKDDVHIVSAGTNHYYWLLKVLANKTITTKDFGPFKSKTIEKNTNLCDDIVERGIYWAQQNEYPLLEKILKLYGHFTIPDQSHPGEYLYWADTYAADEKYDYKKYQQRGEKEKRMLEQTVNGALMNYWWVRSSGERVVDMIIGMEHNTGQRELAVNIPNNGSISNIPDSCVVEIPAKVDKHGIHGEEIGRLPVGIEQLIQHQASLQEIISEAAITGDHNLAIQSLLFDGTLPNPLAAENLLKEMLSIQGKYLPQF